MEKEKMTGLRKLEKLLIFSFFMAIFMMLGLNVKEALAADFQPYYTNVDYNYYDYDGFHVSVGVKDDSNGTQGYRYVWACRYEKWSGTGYNILKLEDNYDGTGGYYGTQTSTFSIYPGLGGEPMADFVEYFCYVIDGDGNYATTDPISMPTPMRATAVSSIKITGLDTPVSSENLDYTAESAESDKYTVNNVIWFKFNSSTGAISRLTKPATATTGKYICRIYFNMVSGYGIDPETVSGLVGANYGDICYDSSKMMYYINVWYDVDGTAQIVSSSKGVRALDGGIKYINVTAINVESYRWQKYENGAYRDIVSGEGYSGFMGRSLHINAGSVVNDTVRCKVTGYTGNVLYSTPVKAIASTAMTVTPYSVYVHEGDSQKFTFELSDGLDGVKNYKWVFKCENMPDWEECADYPEYFSTIDKNTMTIDSMPSVLIDNRCQVKCILEYDDELGNIETKTATIYPYKVIISLYGMSFYIVGGQIQYGFQEYEGNTYYFGSENDGIMKTGWQEIESNWYYFESTGIMVKSNWKKLSDKWYYFDENGVMVTGWKKIGGNWYYFDENGVMQTGWFVDGSKTYYLDKTGKMLKGQQVIDGVTYNFGDDGVLQTGWKLLKNNWYYFGTDGKMATGWKQLNSKWYYFGTDGIMQTGWKKISNKWYYFGTDGKMTTGWKQLNSKWYYFNTSGVMQTGWKKLNNKWYYFKAGGAMAVNESVTIGTTTYKFASNGVMLS